MPSDFELYNWRQWLTNKRLFNWNHLRERAGIEPVNREAGAKCLCRLAKSPNRDDRQTLEEIKARIAE